MEELSEKQLKVGYWYVTHKIVLRGIFFVVLMALNIIVWGWIMFSLVKNLAVDFNSFRQWRYDLLYDRFTNQAMVVEKTQPRSIVVNDVRSLPAQNKNLDLVATVSNPNAGWVGRFQYQFATAKGNTQLRKGFIMPSEQKVLMDLDIDAGAVDRIIFSDVVWERFNNYPAYVAPRDVFNFSTPVFIPLSSSDNVKANRVTFSATNNSNFNYYRPKFTVKLLRTGQLIGINTLTIDSLKSNETQNLEARWFEFVPTPDKIEITPDIDFASPSSYLPIQ